MFCLRCQNSIDNCICPDIEERLRKIQNYVAQRTCTKCGEHVDRCLCYLEDGKEPESKILLRKEE